MGGPFVNGESAHTMKEDNFRRTNTSELKNQNVTLKKIYDQQNELTIQQNIFNNRNMCIGIIAILLSTCVIIIMLL